MKRAEKEGNGRATGKALRAAVMALVGSSMLAMAGGAVGGRPVQGSATAEGACSIFDAGSLFVDACLANVAVAKQMVTIPGYTDAAYTGSCDGGGACADSVYNKLVSAASKFAVPKISDGCSALAAIQSDLTAWNTAGKPKINNSGYNVMAGAIQTIQTGNCP